MTKNCPSKSRFFQKGFTLIELLVVIGILGILVAGVLVAIDPIEQFRKGSDGTTKRAAATLSTALTAYYASNGELPWGATVDCMSGSAPNGTQLSSASLTSCVQELISAGELKSSFTNQTDVLDALYITDTTVGQRTSFNICFDPLSQSDSENAQTRFTDATGTDNSCDPTVSDCYWCTQ